MSERQMLLLVVLVCTNLNAFAMMAIDKAKARKGARRIPEKNLFLATICLGGLGGVLGMQLCRHKTKHWYFAVFFPIILVLQIVLIALLWGRLV